MDSDNIWYVYALFSSDYNRIYIGMTQRPEERLKEHNRGKMKSTKGYRPWIRIFLEKAGNIEQARQLEKYYKTTEGRRKIKKLTPK